MTEQAKRQAVFDAKDPKQVKYTDPSNSANQSKLGGRSVMSQGGAAPAVQMPVGAYSRNTDSRIQTFGGSSSTVQMNMVYSGNANLGSTVTTMANAAILANRTTQADAAAAQAKLIAVNT